MSMIFRRNPQWTCCGLRKEGFTSFQKRLIIIGGAKDRIMSAWIKLSGLAPHMDINLRHQDSHSVWNSLGAGSFSGPAGSGGQPLPWVYLLIPAMAFALYYGGGRFLYPEDRDASRENETLLAAAEKGLKMLDRIAPDMQNGG